MCWLEQHCKICCIRQERTNSDLPTWCLQFGFPKVHWKGCTGAGRDPRGGREGYPEAWDDSSHSWNNEGSPAWKWSTLGRGTAVLKTGAVWHSSVCWFLQCKKHTVSDTTNRWRVKQTKETFHAICNQAWEHLQRDTADYKGVRGFSWSLDKVVADYCWEVLHAEGREVPSSPVVSPQKSTLSLPGHPGFVLIREMMWAAQPLWPDPALPPPHHLCLRTRSPHRWLQRNQSRRFGLIVQAIGSTMWLHFIGMLLFLLKQNISIF